MICEVINYVIVFKLLYLLDVLKHPYETYLCPDKIIN